MLAERLADVRRTRKPRARHDAVVAPVDGDYEPLRLTNTDPDREYFWSSDKDRARLAHRGWVEERWSPTSVRPVFWYGTQQRGETIRFNELTLMSLPADIAAELRKRDPKRRQHAQLMREIIQPSAPGHRSTFQEQTLAV